MAEYIERGTAIAKLTALEVTNPIATMTDAKRLLADAPAADVVPVVRCKDCKHRYSDSWCEYVDDDDNFYCARGERKDGGDDAKAD